MVVYELGGAITHVEQGGGVRPGNRTHTPGTPCGLSASPVVPNQPPSQF
jgi:hypothetical protein